MEMDKYKQNMDKASQEPRHPIQVVARLTGLSPDIVRIWERRYRAVSPQRSPSGRRFYSDAEIERLTLLRQVTAAGRRISDVIHLSERELHELVTWNEVASTQPSGSASFRSGNITERLAACRKAMNDMNPQALQRALADARVALSVPVLLDGIISALLHEVGEQWKSGSVRICEEHMTVAVVRSFLGELLVASNMSPAGPILVVTTPAGQNHELGALMVAIIAALQGWDIVNLGPNTPAAEIAAAAAKTDARAVGLSIVYPPDDARLAHELRTLRRLLTEETTLLVGGRAAVGYRAVLDEIGALCFRSQGELQAALDGLRGL